MREEHEHENDAFRCNFGFLPFTVIDTDRRLVAPCGGHGPMALLTWFCCAAARICHPSSSSHSLLFLASWSEHCIDILSVFLSLPGASPQCYPQILARAAANPLQGSPRLKLGPPVIRGRMALGKAVAEVGEMKGAACHAALRNALFEHNDPWAPSNSDLAHTTVQCLLPRSREQVGKGPLLQLRTMLLMHRAQERRHQQLQIRRRRLLSQPHPLGPSSTACDRNTLLPRPPSPALRLSGSPLSLARAILIQKTRRMVSLLSTSHRWSTYADKRLYLT